MLFLIELSWHIVKMLAWYSELTWSEDKDIAAELTPSLTHQAEPFPQSIFHLPFSSSHKPFSLVAWTCFLDEPSFLHPTLTWVWCLLCPVRGFSQLEWEFPAQRWYYLPLLPCHGIVLHASSQQIRYSDIYLDDQKKPSETQIVSCGGCKPGFISSEDTWTLEEPYGQ